MDPPETISRPSPDQYVAGNSSDLMRVQPVVNVFLHHAPELCDTPAQDEREQDQRGRERRTIAPHLDPGNAAFGTAAPTRRAI